MHSIAAVLDEHDLVLGPEGSVVKAGMTGVAEVEELDRTGVGVGGGGQLHDGTEATKITTDLGAIIGVAGFIKEELGEVRAGMELPIFGTLEGGCEARLRGGICVEGSKAACGSIVNRNP